MNTQKTLKVNGVETPVKENKFLSLNWKDGLKGLIMAVGTPVLYILQELIPGYDIHPVAKAAIAATITYLLKNYFSPSNVVIETKNL